MEVVTANKISCVFMTFLLIGSVFGSLIGLVMFGTAPAAAQHTADGDTVALYHFNEGTGQYVNDSSGNWNNGTLGYFYTPYSDDPTWVDGKFGKALKLDGVDDFINISSSVDDIKRDEGTIEFWVSSNSWSNTDDPWRIIDFSSDNGNSTICVNKRGSFYTGDDRLEALFQINGTPLEIRYNVSGWGSEWHYIAFTWDRIQDKLSLYIDGDLKGSMGSLPQGNPLLVSSAIGKKTYSADQFFPGTVDEVRLSSVARPYSEISGYYNKSTVTGYWKFDDGSGQLAYDSSGNSHNGTLKPNYPTNSPTWVDGISGKALQFDGIDDYVEVKDNSQILGDNPDEWSYSVWFKTGNSGDSLHIISDYDSGSYDLCFSIALERTGSDNLTVVVRNADSSETKMHTTEKYHDNQWHFAVISVSKIEDFVKLYVDGDLKLTGALPSTTADYFDGGVLRIGAVKIMGAPDLFFNGTIDEVCTWNRALGSEEIRQTYEKMIFAGYWKFDEGSGQVAYDSSGNGNDGQLGSTSGDDTNDPKWVDGISGNAIEFDGNDDFLNIPNSSSLNPVNEITLAAWVKFYNYKSGESPRILGKPYESYKEPYTQYDLLSGLEGSYDNRFCFELSIEGVRRNLDSNYKYALNTWYYIVGTYNGTEMRIYVNGELQNKKFQTGKIDVYSTDLKIGKYGLTTPKSHCVNGTIDEVRILNHAIEAGFIKNNYNSVIDVAYWKFDEGSGQVAYDSSGNGNDGQLGSTNGTDTNDPSWVDGISGKALSFDGNDDYVEVNDNATLNFGTNNFTVDAWIKSDTQTSSCGRIVSKGAWYNPGFLLGLMPNGTIRAVLQDQTISYNYYSLNTYDDNHWHHIAFVVDRTADTITIFGDGVKDGGPFDISIIGSINNIGPLFFGMSNASTERYSGIIDELRISNRVLGSSEIYDYYKGFIGNEPDLKITSSGITFSNTEPSPSEEITISAKVSNIGTAAGSATVKFWDRDPDNVNWIKYNGNPVLTPGKSGSWDDEGVAIGSIIKDGDIYKMWYQGKPDSNSWKIGYATSYDGIKWKKYENNPVLSPSDIPYSSIHCDSPFVIKENNTYKMWFTTVYSNYLIGYAESTNGINWTVHNSYVLKTSVSGWDKESVGYPYVIKDGTQYKMWFNGKDKAGEHWNYGYAYSSDGINWTKYSNNPIFINGSVGQWDSDYLGDKYVIKENGRYTMYYSATDSINFNIGLATSEDGISWEKFKGNPVLKHGSAGDFDQEHANNPKILNANSSLRIYYVGSKIPWNCSIGLATGQLNATLIAEKTVTDLQPGKNTTVSTAWEVPSVPGNYTIWVTVEDAAPADYDLSNNKAESANITVVGTAPDAPDLYIKASNIYLNKTSINHGDKVRIYAKIWNNGLKDATSANVTFWDGDPAEGGVFIDNVISQFAHGYMTVRFTDWKAPAGKHTIYVWIKDVIPADATLTNNKAYITVTVNRLPGLVKPIPDVSFDEDTILYNAFDLDDHFSDTSYVGLGIGKDHSQLTTDGYAQRYPFFAPDGKTIIYDSLEDGGSYRDIWSMDSQGKNRGRLTNDNYHQEQPAFSPDGKDIVYSSYEDGGGYADIWLMAANGSNRVRLTNENYNQSAPKFSPDGTKIVYYSKEDGGLYNDIWQLTRNGAAWDASCTHSQLSKDSSTQYNPVFSPDGGRIAFEDDSGSPGTWNIWTMNDSGGDRKQLTTAGGRGPLYSPDGQVIIYFSRENSSAYWDVWLMTADGKEHTQLTIEQADQLYGCFSPDGAMIVYNSNEDNGVDIDIWLMKFHKDTLTFTVSGNAHVKVTINPDRTVDFSADANWFGSENITIRAADPDGYYAEDTFMVTVKPVNDAPVLSDIPDIMFKEDQFDSNLDLDYFVSDVDNSLDQLTWSVSGTGFVIVSIDGGTHKVNFSAAKNWWGQETVYFKVTDPGGLYDTDSVKVTVTPENDPPKISGLPDVQFDEDTYNNSLDLDNYVTDPDDDINNLTWSIINGGKVKIYINNKTHVANFTAEKNWFGKNNITFKVTDPHGLWDIYTITVTVNAENDPPKVIGPVPDFSMKEDTVDNTTIDLKKVFYDVDDDKLTYSVSGNKNIVVTIASDGKVTLRPKKDWYGEEILIFGATDGKSAKVTDTVKVNVTAVNDPPKINGNGIQFALSSQNIYEDISFTLDLTPFISDVDSSPSAIKVTESSQFVTVSGNKLILTYPEGIIKDEFTITVTDGENQVYTTVQLNIIPVNDPPLLWHIPAIEVDEGETVVLSPKATDLDNTDTELTISYSGSMDSAIWVTSFTDAGTYTVNVTVTDGELVDWQLVTITVNDKPQPPIIEPIPAQEVDENRRFTLRVPAWDWDEDTLTYTLIQAPKGMSIDPGTGEITWQPSFEQVGDHLVTVNVADGMFNTTSSFKLTVININDPPVANVIYYTGVSAYNGEKVNFTLRITGTKYMAVTMSLYQDGVLLDRDTITRVPDSPKEQLGYVNARLDLDKEYALGLEYVADELGAAPVKLTVAYGGSSVVMHYTFNAMHGEKKEVVYDINAIIENNPVNDKTVRFDASGSFDIDGTIKKYKWNFGDGSTGTGAVVTHVYKKIDWYTVKLTLTDNEDESSSVTYQVNPAYSSVVLPAGGGTDVIDYSVTGKAQITAVYVANPSKVVEGTIGIFINYTLQGEGTLKWVNITVSYADIVLPGGIDESKLRLYWYDEETGKWMLCERTGVDTVNKVVWANTTHFTVFAPMAEVGTAENESADAEFMLLPVILGIIVFFILGIALTSAVVRSEKAMENIGRLQGHFISEEYKTDNELRGRILGMIEARPGVHYSWIKVNIAKGNGVCAYHLDKLEKDGVIKSKRDPPFKRYYPKDSTKNGEAKPVLSDIQNQIIEIIQEHPGASQKEIGYLLDESKSKINYHIKQMERKGIIKVLRDDSGQTACYHIKDKETSYIPSAMKKKLKKKVEEKPLKEIHVQRKMKMSKKKFADKRSTKSIIKKHKSSKKEDK